MKNKINTLTKEELQNIVKESNSLADILRKLNLYVSSGNYRPLKIRLENDNIDYSHIKLGLNANKGKKFLNKTTPLSELLIDNSTKYNSQLKKKLLDNNILKNECILCGLGPKWQGNILTLQLDHIDGNSRNNILENLRILCPNCHTQTSTYGSKNRKPKLAEQKYCECGNKIKKKSTQCIICSNKNKTNHQTKIDWPSKEELLIMLSINNCRQVAKKLGVSDTAIKKRLAKTN